MHATQPISRFDRWLFAFGAAWATLLSVLLVWTGPVIHGPPADILELLPAWLQWMYAHQHQCLLTSAIGGGVAMAWVAGQSFAGVRE